MTKIPEALVTPGNIAPDAITSGITNAKLEPLPEFLIRTRVFVGFYHYRHAAPQQRIFNHEGDLFGAIERFRQHCIKMNYRFIKVRPHIVDLDDIEKRRENNGWEEDY